jgi:hypothetical protein
VHLLDLYIDAPYLRSIFAGDLTQLMKPNAGRKITARESRAFSDILGHPRRDTLRAARKKGRR